MYSMSFCFWCPSSALSTRSTRLASAIHARFPAPFIRVYSMRTRLKTSTSAIECKKVRVNNLLYSNRKINALLNIVQWVTMYIMQCKLPLERRQRFMTRATEYSSVKSVSSSLFTRAPTSQLIKPPAMRADCTERLRRKSEGTYMYMYPYVWMYIPSRIPIRIAKAMRERQKRTWGWASAVWRGCARVWERRPDRCAASSPARPLCLSSLSDVAMSRCLIKDYIHLHVVNCSTQWILNIL